MSDDERPDVHDRVLRDVVVHWSSAAAELVFESMRIICSGVVAVRVPRENPWGPSVHANGATIADGVLRLEMQSGDVIEIRAAAFRVDVNARGT